MERRTNKALSRRYGKAGVGAYRVVQVPQRDSAGRIVFWRASPIGASRDFGALHGAARRLYGSDYRIIEATGKGGNALRVWPLPSQRLENGTVVAGDE